MTDGNWVQSLIDKHGGDMLNYINTLKLTHYERTMLEIKAKELLMAVASNVMHETKDQCLEIFAKSLKVKK